MKPSIDKMLNRSYEEAVKEIEQKIEDALFKKHSYLKRAIDKKHILKYIVKHSDEKNQLIIRDSQCEIFPEEYKLPDDISIGIMAGQLQSDLSGFIGWIPIYQTKNKRRKVISYFFRNETIENFRITYHKEPDYLPLKQIFLEILNQKT
ncbi:MAG: hypothetical protein U9O53_03880 [archaeon]|nr:hypothetical protein [archaeon]